MGSIALSRPIVRLAFYAFLVGLPLTTAWNLTVGQSYPSMFLRVGPHLGGVTYDTPVIFSWSEIRNGAFQKAVANRIAEAIPIRPLLIHVNNEMLVQMFGEVNAPNVFKGVAGQLSEKSYLEDYCARTEGMGAKAATAALPKLKDIQNFYQSHGAIFVFVISPSKVADMPEYFTNYLPCPSTPAARTQLVPDYVGALRQGGIHVVDAASLIHSLRGSYPFDLFPQGGEHWNEVGGARAVSAIVEAINQQAGREIIPPFTFTYQMSGVLSGADRELVNLLNVFFPPLSYQAPKVSFQPSIPCAESPARQLDIEIVSSSFGHLPARMMIEGNCLARLQLFYYATLGRFGGEPYHELQRNLSDGDLSVWRNAKVMILEENESFIASNKVGYVDQLRAVVNRP